MATEAAGPVVQPQMTESEGKQRLKYLKFVLGAALHVVVLVPKLYHYVEGTLRTVVGPVYNKFHDSPIELREFVDRKMNLRILRPLRKLMTLSKADEFVKNGPLRKLVASAFKTAGVVETAPGLAKPAVSVPHSFKYCMEKGERNRCTCQTWTFRVSISCIGCKIKIKKILQEVQGVFMIKIETEQEKVTVTGEVDANTLLRKFSKAGMHAEFWLVKDGEEEKMQGMPKNKENRIRRESNDDTSKGDGKK